MILAIRKHLSDFIALAILFAIGVGVTVYIVSQQESRGYFPFVEKPPFELKAEFSDAQAVIPGQGQTVRVAGVEVGKISKVEPKNGVAVVTMDLNRDKIDNHELQLLTDATAQLRPRTGLKDMFVELDPGTSGAKLKENATIPVANSEPDIDPDETFSALDVDTRAYLQLLIGGLGKGFRGHGKDLNATFKALGPTNRDLKRVSQAVSTRRHELARLVHNYADLTNTLANRDKDVSRLVSASNVTLSAFAQENQNISLAVSLLPSTLTTTSTTLNKVNTFAAVLRPALESLRPAFRQLDVANHAVLPFVREAYPITKNKIRPFIRVARPYIATLRPAVRNLAKATPDLTSSLQILHRFFNMAAYNPNGREPVPSTGAAARARDEGYLFWVGWVGHMTDSLFNSGDARGPFRRSLFGLTCATLQRQVSGGFSGAGPLGPAADAALLGLDQLTAPTG
ncbi:MAG: phospholipid/cholesterol/gamma-HCH transport system substrate-binding protein, partial [Thermoleophilaceae bacterium]|nr:phospholipid/cholesterol/gamma-HCH transport system substrate-binding protein [Thermoleophilaceae bacterium]